jgi:methionine-rich copper-binding protein CopC
MKPALALLLLTLAAALALPASPAFSQIELSESDPPDGARLDAPPAIIHLCFSQLVSTLRPSYEMPDGQGLSLQISFQPDGQCVDIRTELPEERPTGEYIFSWLVTAAGSDEEEAGSISFHVETDGGPDILLITLITVAVIGGAAVLTSLLYLVRRSIGFEPHRPPEGDESGGEEH